MFIDNQFAVGVILVSFVIGLLFCSMLKLHKAKEALCVDPIKCGSGKLVDANGNPFVGPATPIGSVEPRDPYMTSSMVYPKSFNDKVDFEKRKITYLTDANRVYMDIANDSLNQELLPRGLLFTGP